MIPLHLECVMQVIQVTLGTKNTWGLKNTIINSIFCLLTTLLGLQCLHAKAITQRQLFCASQLPLPMGQGSTSPDGPRFPHIPQTSPFCLLLYFPLIPKNQFSLFKKDVSQRNDLVSCKFRNKTLVVAEEICRTNSACIPVLQKEELTVAGLHLEPTYSTNFPNPDSPLIPYNNTQ